MDKDWCGKPCSECDGCSLDESMPCSPCCENLLPNGSRLLRDCLGCDAYERTSSGETSASFIDDCACGAAVLNDIDNYIDYWHTHETGKSLCEYLGMTDDEYSDWIKIGTDSYLQTVIDSRRAQRGISEGIL